TSAPERRLDVRSPNHLGVPPPGTAEPQAQNRTSAAQPIRNRVLKRRTPPDGFREGKPLPRERVRALGQSGSGARQGPSHPPLADTRVGAPDLPIADVVALLQPESIQATCSDRGSASAPFSVPGTRACGAAARAAQPPSVP